MSEEKKEHLRIHLPFWRGKTHKSTLSPPPFVPGDENFFPHFFFIPMMFARFTIDSCSSSCWKSEGGKQKKSLEGAVVVFHFSSVVDEIFRFPLLKRVPGEARIGKVFISFYSR